MRRRASYQNLLGSTGNTLVVTLQALVLVPIYLVEIGPRLYGAWLGTGEILVWMQALDLGLPTIMLQRLAAAHGRGDRRAVGSGFSSSFVVLLVVAGTLYLLATILSIHVPGWMGLAADEGAELAHAFRLGALAAALNIVNLGLNVLSKAIQRTGFMNAMLVVAGLVGVATSLVLILRGFGLVSIPLGMLARSLCYGGAGVVFVSHSLRNRLVRLARPDRDHIRHMLRLSPVTAGAGISYALMNQSQAALIAFLADPALSTVYVLTRRATDVIRMLLDAIGHSAFGAFAHLVTSDQRHRAARVHGELFSLRLSLAIAATAAYWLVNEKLVNAWVGPSQFGGPILTLLLGVQLLAVGNSYFLNYLYRATGAIARGSVLLMLEAAIRLPCMAVLLLLWGLPGLPLAGAVVATVFGAVAWRETQSALQRFSDPVPRSPWRLHVGRVVVLAVGAAGGLMLGGAGWWFVVVVGGTFAAISALVLIGLDPRQDVLRRDVKQFAARFRPGTSNRTGARS